MGVRTMWARRTKPRIARPSAPAVTGQTLGSPQANLPTRKANISGGGTYRRQAPRRRRIRRPGPPRKGKPPSAAVFARGLPAAAATPPAGGTMIEIFPSHAPAAALSTAFRAGPPGRAL